jgi:hypothetical protein
MHIDSRKPHRNPHYRLEAIDDELLLFDPTSTQIMYCNPTASLIWQLCDGTHSVLEITGLLADAFPEEAEAISRDVREMVECFFQHGAVEFV